MVIAHILGELTVKRPERQGHALSLVSANREFPPIEITDWMDFEVWGVVTGVIRRVR